MAISALPDERAARYPHSPAWVDLRTGRLPHVHRPKQPPAVDQGEATASVAADHRQAEYFLQLLLQSRLEVGNRIDEHHRAIAIAETRRDPGQVQRLRRMVGIGEHERDVVDGLIDNLQRRFPIGHHAVVPTISRRARPVVR